MRAINAALDRIDQVAAQGDLTIERPSEPLALDTLAEPVILPDGKRIYPPRLHGQPVDELACALLDMTAPAESTFLRLTGLPGTGKALAVDTPIATPDGWKRMAELRVGDQVFDDAGHAVRIVGVSDVMTGRDCCEVVFSDGSTIVADGDHLWVTETRADRVRAPRVACRGGYLALRVGSDDELAAVRTARSSSGPERVTRRQLARELGWDTDRGYRRVKTASSRCVRFGHRGREVLFARAELLESLTRMLSANVGEHNRRRIVSGPFTTRQLRATLRTAQGRTNHAIRVSPALTTAEARLPIAPRLLGLWLGDGDARKAVFCSADLELVQEFVEHGYRVKQSGYLRYSIAAGSLVRPHPTACVTCGASIEPGRQRRWYCPDCCTAGEPKRRGPLTERSCRCGARIHPCTWGEACRSCQAARSFARQLRELGVLCDKHIPSAYLRASAQQRRALLSGLLDTDGTVGRGGAVEYTTTTQRLGADVHELVCSLGHRATLRRVQRRGRHHGG